MGISTCCLLNSPGLLCIITCGITNKLFSTKETITLQKVISFNTTKSHKFYDVYGQNLYRKTKFELAENTIYKHEECLDLICALILTNSGHKT